ncbi:hypothetical protein UPYG_G00229550 [Umbra pygmaea]|uniref:Uncharacterized protein n=1 Tax=Umbra pygmaea TaxID=75934 RepID=A0ABD0WD46_UMBPY
MPNTHCGCITDRTHSYPPVAGDLKERKREGETEGERQTKMDPGTEGIGRADRQKRSSRTQSKSDLEKPTEQRWPGRLQTAVLSVISLTHIQADPQTGRPTDRQTHRKPGELSMAVPFLNV